MTTLDDITFSDSPEAEIELLPHQYEFLNDTTTRYLALCGGYGCGKTHAFILKAISLAFANPGCEGAILEPTIDMARRLLIPDMCRILEDLDIEYIFRRADKEFYIQCEDGEWSKIHVLSGENYTRLVGLNLAWFGVDEVDTIKQDTADDMFDVLISRIRDKSAKVIQGYFTSTPEGFKFLYNKFQKEVDDSIREGNPITDRRIIKGKTTDNPFLADGFIDSLLRNYSSTQVQAYINGEFVNFHTDTVYYAFDGVLNHSDSSYKDFEKHVLHIGMDFNVGKCSAVVHVIDGHTPIAIDEFTKIKNTEAMVDAIKTRYPDNKIIVYPDASGGSRKTSSSTTDHLILRQGGFKVMAPSKNPYVKDRINSMNAMFCNAKNERRYLINTTKCPIYTQCLIQQGYDRNGDPDKSNDLDHSNDAAGYFINMRFPIKSKATMRVM